MSFQYINPYVQNFYPAPVVSNQPYLFQPQVTYSYNFVQNPIETSFYNQNTVFPYSPLYTPKINGNYTKIGQTKSPNGDDLHLFELKNGQKVAIIPRKDEATIVKTFLNGGSMNETDDIRGISHCIEHCLFKGSSKLNDGDVFRLTSLMGASTNASTDFAQTDYYITAPYMDENNLAKTIQIQGDMISNPAFDKEAIESEKGPICSEISMINDVPTTVAFDKAIRNLFQIDSNSHNLVAGSIETVSNLTQNDIINHHKTYYSPQDLYTVIVGDVDVDKTIEEVSKNFTIPKAGMFADNNKTKQQLIPIQKSTRADIRSSKTNYTTSIIAFAGPTPKDGKDFLIFDALNYYLKNCSSSYLKSSLEKMNAEYDSSLQKVGLKKDDPYAIMNAIISNPNDEQKALDLFYDSILRLQSTPLTDDELKSIHNFIQKDIEIKLCDSENVCDLLGKCLLDDSIDVFTNYKQLAQTITKEDVMNFARKYFDLNKASIVVVHPSSVSEDDIIKNYSNSKYSAKTNYLNSASSIVFKGNKKSVVDSVEQYKLPNNTNLVLNNTNSNLCVFNWSVNTSPVKPKNPNIPAVLRYMFQKGTNYKNQVELERYKELNAIDADVYVNGKSIEINANCLPQESAKTLALLNELMYNPNFTQSDFEDAKRYVKDMLKASQKDAGSNLLDRVYPGYFPNDAEKLRKIDELTIDDIKDFWKELLSQASSSFVATMPMDRYPFLKDAVVEYQNNSIVNFKNNVPKLAPIFQENQQETIVYDIDDLNQAQICKSYVFPMTGNIEDEAKFELVNTILGGSPSSRLFRDLREKQNLAYSVSSSIQSFENTGILTLSIQTTTDNKEQNAISYDNVEKSLEGFKKHTGLLCSELVSDEELQAAKMKLKQNLIGQCQNPMSETQLLAMNALEPYGINRIDKYFEIIDKITKEDIKQAANYIFSYKPTTSILASEDTIKNQMPYLEKEGAILKADS